MLNYVLRVVTEKKSIRSKYVLRMCLDFDQFSSVREELCRGQMAPMPNIISLPVGLVTGGRLCVRHAHIHHPHHARDGFRS